MLSVLVAGAFLGTLNQTIVTPVMPLVMGEMGVSAGAAQWLTTGFMLVNAIMIPIAGYLTDRFSTRGLFLAAMGIFTLGTLLVAWSPAFWVVLAGRLIQAAGAGILMPMVMIVLMLNIRVGRRGLAMGLYGLVIGGGPALGPTVAGLLIGIISWRAMFVMIALLAIAVICTAPSVLDRSEPAQEDLALDKLSVILSTLGFGCLLYGCSVVDESGSLVIAAVAVIMGTLALVGFFRRQLRVEMPMLQVRVLANRDFRIGTILIMIVQVSLIVVSVLIPIYVQSIRGFSATTSGLIILPGAIIMGCVGPLAGHALDRRGPRRLAIAGFLILTLGTVAMAFLGQDTGVVYLSVLYAIRLIGIALLNMPLTTWAINALDDRLVNHGISLNNTFRQVAGSLGTALLVSVMTLASGQTNASSASIFGLDCAFAVAAALSVVGLVLAILSVGKRGDEERG